ncbi:FimV/HubP family polar landmark protein [Undibacterium griseum]|uniref:FimV family protein n=1 Tax=Undibacterium griseum TaxID=2762295 RepID=A0ABR6YR62_9BURK|nr:FimV/HubP family polar landmark protein [Undibacterium griseum]MBC3886269.1 FimV family protein [Undibacterium griseum]
MLKQKRTSVISLGRKALSVAVASTLLFVSNAHATGMGRLTVLSSLGQPLRAEIELTSPDKDEVGSLVPKLASADAFRQANIDFNPALLSFRFAIEQRGTGYVIKVNSTQAMNEPFVDMLLEMNSSNGKLLREYTFLLDPAELRNSQSPQVSSPNVVNSKAQTGGTAESVGSRLSANTATAGGTSTSLQIKKNTAATPVQSSAGEYSVKAGDTLGKVAGAYRKDGISLDQMLVSLYRANPQAFIGNNMNRLKAGQILVIPDTESVRAASNSEAHSVVMAHAADFNAYRNKLADYVERTPAAKSQSVKQTASGAISAKVKEVPNLTAESPDKLKLSKAAASTPGANGKGVSEEDKLAKNKAAADASNRVKELEKNVNDLQRLLEIKNKDLASKEAELNVKGKQDTKMAAASAAQEKAAAVPAPASAPASSAQQVSASAAVSATASATAVPASVSASAASVTKPPRRRPVPPPPPPEPGFFDSISDFLVPGGALILALLGGVGLWANNRKKKLQQFEDSILTGSSMKANSMFGSTGGQSVDTNNSVFNSNFAPSASQLDANEVDPVAEADVYIAYGRDSQAEEILKEALRTQPDRHAVRVKLLEIYFARKDAKTFERLASELYGMTSGEGEEWAQAASMGIVLEPGNPLYAGGQAKAEAGVSVLGVTTQPLEDLDPDALLANSLSRDMLDAISIIDTASKPESPTLTDGGAHAVEEAAPLHMDHAVDLDFDLGLGESEVPVIPESAPAAAMQPAQEEVPVVDFGTIDFDFGDHKTSTEPAPPEHDSAQLSADESVSVGLDMLDFNLSPEKEQASAPVPADKNVSGTTEGLDLEMMQDEKTEHEAQASTDSVSAFEFDLSGIDLELEPAKVQEEQPAHSEPVVAEAETENAEMSTKLDLAVAYHEIGDKEGARELLDEVMKGGNASQKARAESMLAQMV